MARDDTLPFGNDRQYAASLELPAPGLHDSERRLLASAATGQPWRPADDTDDARTIRGEVVRTLIIGARWTQDTAPWRLAGHGLILDRAIVEGDIDLEGQELLAQLWIRNSRIDGTLKLRDAKTRTIGFDGSDVEAISAQRIDVDGGFYLRKGFCARRGIDLRDGRIRGLLDCSASTVVAAPVTDPNDDEQTGCAIAAHALSVGASILLSKGFRAQGQISLFQARIGGNLECRGGFFASDCPDKRNDSDMALCARAMAVGGDILLNDDASDWRAPPQDGETVKTPFRAVGKVDLSGVRVGGNVLCRGGDFRNPDHTALTLQAARIEGGLFCCKLARFIGTLDLRQATAQSFGIDTTVIRDNRHAHPPGTKRVLLDGFVYQKLAQTGIAVADLLAWIDPHAPRPWWRRLADRFCPTEPNDADGVPQPWSQLIRVLRDTGHEREAAAIVVAREQADIRAAFATRRRRTMTILKRIAFGYGFDIARYALVWGAVLLIAGGSVFWAAHQRGFIAPHERTTCTAALAQKASSPFDVVVYTLDVFLPVVDFGQDRDWQPVRVPYAPHADVRTGACETAPPTANDAADWAFRRGAHRLVYWIEEFFGLICVSFFLAATGGFIRKR